MKICPLCGKTKVIIFDSNNDWCNDCQKWFPAVKEITDKLTPETIQWYESQIQELSDIKKSFHIICGDITNKNDAYFPDLVHKELAKLKEIEDRAKQREKAERNSPKNFPKSWGY